VGAKEQKVPKLAKHSVNQRKPKVIGGGNKCPFLPIGSVTAIKC